MPIHTCARGKIAHLRCPSYAAARQTDGNLMATRNQREITAGMRLWSRAQICAGLNPRLISLSYETDTRASSRYPNSKTQIKLSKPSSPQRSAQSREEHFRSHERLHGDAMPKLQREAPPQKIARSRIQQ